MKKTIKTEELMNAIKKISRCRITDTAWKMQ